MTGKTTVEKTGNKTDNVKTLGTKRIRLSLLLAINDSGGKLKPLIVFKGKFNPVKQNRLNKKIYLANKDSFIVYQENSWVTKEIFY